MGHVDVGWPRPGPGMLLAALQQGGGVVGRVVNAILDNGCRRIVSQRTGLGLVPGPVCHKDTNKRPTVIIGIITHIQRMEICFRTSYFPHPVHVYTCVLSVLQYHPC